jgi:4-amino-4-deoxy-L-arabinose transferase-like glycosyltransferase
MSQVDVGAPPFPARRRSSSETASRPLLELRYLLCAAVLLRIIVFAFIGVSNNDDHLEVVRYVAQHGQLPRIDQFNQAYHPPLYYLVAAAVLSVSGSVKVVQSISLICSIVALALAWYLIGRLTVANATARFWALTLVSLHPQFVMYTMFISNDPLAIALGLTVLALAYRYFLRPTIGAAVAVAAVLGLGLATKFTFLAFIPAVVGVLFVVSRRHGWSLRKTFASLAVVAIIVAGLGSYKFIDNARVVGSPLASNLDVWPWAESHKPTWTGPMTLFDVNLMKLVRMPTVSEETVHSYPLMLYGSFWYQFFPDSTFRSNTKRGLNVIGSVIYLCAVVPTAVMLIGLVVILWRSAAWMRSGRAWRLDDAEGALRLLAVLMLLMNTALILRVGWTHDVYSVFNSRLLFPAYLGFVVCLAVGIGAVADRWSRLHRTNAVMLRALHGLFVIYVALDIAIAIARPVDPLITHHLPYRIDMTPTVRR